MLLPDPLNILILDFPIVQPPFDDPSCGTLDILCLATPEADFIDTFRNELRRGSGKGGGGESAGEGGVEVCNGLTRYWVLCLRGEHERDEHVEANRLYGTKVNADSLEGQI